MVSTFFIATSGVYFLSCAVMEGEPNKEWILRGIALTCFGGVLALIGI